MTRIIGRLTSVGMAIEATRGTGLAATFWVPVRGLDFDDKVTYQSNDSGFGRIEEVNDSIITELYSEGSFDGKVFDKSIGAELSAVFGAKPTTTTNPDASTTVKDHAFAIAQNNIHQSLSLEVKEANNDLRYVRAMTNTFKVEAVLDDYFRRTHGFMAAPGTSTTGTVAYTNENEFIPKHINAKIATNLAGLAGASVLKIRSVTFDIKKNAELLMILGQNTPDDIANKSFTVEGTIEAYYDDSTTWRAKVFANTKQALRVQIINTDTIIGTSANPSLTFDFAQVAFQEWSRGFDNNNVMTQSIKFTGQFSIADTSMMTAKLTNLQSAY